MSNIYTPQWRDAQRHRVKESARALVPRIIELFHPRSVIDIGCGEGWFASWFEANDVHTTKVDGPWCDDVLHVDLEHPPYPELGPYDLVLCLETAEHIDAKHADEFVDWLKTLAPTIVFSAAIPGQGGEGHVNEQPPSYWVERFHLPVSNFLRWDSWSDDRIAWWYRQNMLVFGELGDLIDDVDAPHVIHPDMARWKRWVTN